MAYSLARRQLVSRIGNATRRDSTTQEELERLRQDLKALQLEEHIKAHLSSAPALRPDQRERLAALLRTGEAA